MERNTFAGAMNNISMNVQVELHKLQSSFLNRDVLLTIILPPDYEIKPYPVLWLNDGQDIPSLDLIETIKKLYSKKQLRYFIVAGIHANSQRMQEYGTLEMPDFKNRGEKAGLYSEFVIRELVPFIRTRYNVSLDASNNVFCGFSLGALSAINIVWNFPEFFGKAGIFSGSLWWRKRTLSRWYREDRDRIIHQVIRNSDKREGLKFWFEAGTADEKGDRNKNGVIDSVDDTVDLIKELKTKGYTNDDIQFVLVKGGEHNQETWREAMPHFLKWAFGIKDKMYSGQIK